MSLLGASFVALLGCGGLEPPAGTGGVDVAAGPSGRGHAVVTSDYQSTNVALLDCRGRTLSGSFLSSGSASPGLAAPLSGDVVLPSEIQVGPELALLDRYPAAVVSFVEFASARVTAQVDVSTGFRSNPQDLLTVGGELWITRYENNPTPGKVPFDSGGDVLVVDRTRRAILDRIDLASAVEDAVGFWPRPGRMARLGGLVFVLLSAYDASFASAADSRVAVLDVATRKLLRVRVLAGLAGCGALALEPPFDEAGEPRSTRRLVVACSGRFSGSSTPSLVDSGVVALDAGASELPEVGRWGAVDLDGRPAGFDLAVDERGRALVTAMGRLGDEASGDLPDALVEVPLDGGATRVVTRTASRPFELGGVRCATRLAVDVGTDEPSCPADCFVTDGEAGVVRRLQWRPEGYEFEASLVVDTAVGLPPRWLGRF